MKPSNFGGFFVCRRVQNCAVYFTTIELRFPVSLDIVNALLGYKPNVIIISLTLFCKSVEASAIESLSSQYLYQLVKITEY